MNAVRVHAVLLVVALLAAFQTWTRDESASGTDEGAVTLWQREIDDIVSVTFETPARMLSVERRVEGGGDAATPRETFLWGVTLTKRSTADTSTADTTSGVPAVVREEFPVGDVGDELFERLASLRALRDLGELDDDAKAEYELAEPERTMQVAFADGDRQLALGARVFGAAHRYALDLSTGRGYVISNDVLRQLEGSRATLESRELHRYDADDVGAISVHTQTATRHMIREGSGPGVTWTSPDTPGEPDQTFANFVERVDGLSIIRYDAELNVDTLELVVRVEYTGQNDQPLGFLEIFRGPEDDRGIGEYYLRTEATRIAAHTHRSIAERVRQDVIDMF